MIDVALLTNNRVLRRHATRAIASVDCNVRAYPYDGAALSQGQLSDRAICVVDSDVEPRILDQTLRDLRSRPGLKTIFLSSNNISRARLAELLQHGPIHHLIGRFIPVHKPEDLYQSSPIDEQELAVTCKKILANDIFGLEKHLMAWSIRVHQREIFASRDKGSMIADVETFLRRLECHRVIIPAISLVVDELLMNAFFNAPCDASGKPTYRHVDRRETVTLDKDRPVRLSFACDGRYVGLSVRDAYGTLTADTVTQYLRRNLIGEDIPPTKHLSQGAGLGLFMVFNSANRLIINIEPGVQTEVIALFYIRDGGRAFRSAGQSLHIFESAGASLAS